jgi:type II secretory pathway pseudopilin PulG
VSAPRTEAGFTLIEVLLTVGLVTALCAISFASLGRPQTTTSLNVAVDTLVADLKSQQLLAMTGGQGDTTAAQPHGIALANDHYTLFSAISYTSQDPGNYAVSLGPDVSLSTTLPNAVVLFAKSSGEVQDFVNGDNIITIQKNSAAKTLTINRFGMITVE